MKYGVVLFYTSSAALRAEKVLGQVGLPARLIPTPRDLSSDCGIVLRFDITQRQQVESLLTEAHVETVGVHDMSVSL